MKEFFKHRKTTFLSVCLLLTFNSHLGNSTDESQLKRCCDKSSVRSTSCREYCHSYLEMMNGTDVCVKDFNRILKCNSDTRKDRANCCQQHFLRSPKCNELCINYEQWIKNFTSNCDKERPTVLLCFVETVLPAVPPTIISHRFSNKSNDLTRIECDARGKPNVTYRWKKDSKPLQGKNQRILEINPVADDDEGFYQCLAENKHGTAISDVLHLRKATTNSPQERDRGAPYFNDVTDGPNDVIVTEGCNATFRCNASANTAVNIKWYWNDRLIDASNPPERFEILNETLTIRNVCRDCVDGRRESDLMVIQCNASNVHGYAFGSGSLNVLKKTKVITSINDTNVVVPADNNTDLNICCLADSDPVVSLGTRLTWYRKREDGGCSEVAEHRQGNRTGITALDNILVIKIDANDTKAWTRYGGEYVCVGQHRHSRAEQVVTVYPNAHVDLKLVRKNTTDGKGVVFECTFSSAKRIEAVKFEKFRWYLKGEEILNPIQQSFDNTEAGPGCSTCTAKLTFPSIPSQHSGSRVRCVAEYWSQMRFSRFREDVLPVVPPEVSIKSSAYDVYPKQFINLTCTVTNIDHINATEVTFNWHEDGRHKSSHDSILTMSLSLTKDKSSVIIGCSATTKHGTGAFQNVTITVLKPKDEVCLQDTDHDQNLTWPLTKMNSVAKHQCPGNTTGDCSRNCDRSKFGQPEWSTADCSRCVHPILTSILKKIDNFEGTTGNNNRSQVANVVKDLSDFTNQTDGLQYGDLSSSVNAVAGLVRLQQKNEGQPPKKEEVKWAVSLISNLLEPVNEQSWNSLTQSNKSAAATLMALGDSYGSGLTEIINKTEDGTPVREVTTQVVLEAVSKKVEMFPQNFTFPSPTGDDWGESNDRISLSVHKVDIAGSKDNSSLKAWSLYYRNINEFLPSDSGYRLASRVLSLSVAEIENGTNLEEHVKVILQHASNTTVEKRKRKCVYSNFQSNDGRKASWSSEGCTVERIESNENQTVCHCKTFVKKANFAILMSLNPSDDKALDIITKIGCIISIACLILTIIIYAVTWKQVKSHQAAVLLNLCVALIIAYLIFLTGLDKVDAGEIACKTVAVLLHYFFLAAVCLMLAEGVQLFIFVYFVFHVRRRRETAALIVAGWVLPLIIVAVSLGVTKTDGYTREHACWLSNDGGLLWAFVGPVFVITAINIAIVVAVLRKIVCARVVSSKKEQDNKIRKMAWSLAVLCPVLGIAWIFGVLSISSDWIGFQYIFTIANSFQGLFIFIFHGLYSNKKTSEKISSFVSEVISRTPFKKRLDTTVTSTSSTAPTGAKKAHLGAKEISSQDKKSQVDSITEAGGREGNDYSELTSEPQAGSDVSAQVHSHDTTTPL